MEDSSIDIKSESKTKGPVQKVFLIILKSVLILLTPLLFIILIGFISLSGQKLGLFYLSTTVPLLITLILILVSWLYLIITFTKIKTKRFAQIILSLILISLVTSAVMETAGVHRHVQIEKAFVAPSGWEKQTEGNGTRITPGPGLLGCVVLMEYPVCPEIRSTWEKTSGQILTLKDLQEIAELNGYENFKMTSERCGKSTSSTVHGCSMSGTIDKVNVNLGYYGNGSGYWELRLNLTS